MAETSAKKIALLIVCLALFAVTGAWAWFSKSTIQLSPDIALQIIDGRNIELKDLSGKPLIITFWATTCKTCVKKTPELKALYQKFQPEGLELIAVAMSYDPPNRILAFSRNNNIPYPIALDLDGSVARAFNDVGLTPTIFLIDGNGKIVFSKTGNISIKKLDARISEMLSKEKSEAEIQTG